MLILKRHYACVLTILACLVIGSPAMAEKLSLSQGWRFHNGNVIGAEKPAFNDSDWRFVSVPHDGSIMDRSDGTPPFDKTAISGQDSGYLPGIEGWYRRDIDIDAQMAAKVVRLQFEAVYMNAEIWLNGQPVAKHAFGYTAFMVDLTGKVKPGKNTLAVHVNHKDPSSRWYGGTGIIRPVYLETLSQVHIDPDQVVIATPLANAVEGMVSTRTVVTNQSSKVANVLLVTKVLNGAGEIVAHAQANHAVAAKRSFSFGHDLSVAKPALWSIESPNLYTLVQTVSVGAQVMDTRATRFGIRTLSIDAKTGVRLNGKPIKLMGGNIHHDNYMLGAAGIPDADARKVRLMKSAGYNSIRSAHNPASQATLDTADEVGMLVIDEAFDAWNNSKRSRDYAQSFKTDWQSDIRSLVVSGRNHPSVIFWSIGNEIPEEGKPEGLS